MLTGMLTGCIGSAAMLVIMMGIACGARDDSKKLCEKFKTKIQVADETQDLDTLRACYLLETTDANVTVADASQTTTTATTTTSPGPIVGNTTASRPFGLATDKGSVPVVPLKITTEPIHAVRPNGTKYHKNGILAGDTVTKSAGTGVAATPSPPVYPPKPRDVIAAKAGAQGGAIAGKVAGAEAGKTAGEQAGKEAGKEAAAVFANESYTRDEVRAKAYKAGFEAGKEAGSEVVSGLVAKNVTLSTATVRPAAKKEAAPAKKEVVSANKTATQMLELNESVPHNTTNSSSNWEYSGFLSKFVSAFKA